MKLSKKATKKIEEIKQFFFGGTVEYNPAVFVKEGYKIESRWKPNLLKRAGNIVRFKFSKNN